MVHIDLERFPFKGVDIAAIDLYRTLDIIGKLAIAADGLYITSTGAHGIVESVYDARIRVAHKGAMLVVADGMPIVWLGRWLGFKSVGRVNGPEFMECFFSRREARQLRHFFYGTTPSVISKLRDVLVSRFGDFNMVGMYCPPMQPLGFREDEKILAKIRELKPHILWVGLSTPKQELWLHMHMHKIGSGVGIPVGAAFDLLSGTTRRAPRWIQRSGFEWLFRLAVEPRRLYRRYFRVVPRFTYFFLQALINRR
jgi:N-acetylglucosaminyldiphosphoundecaprenol N-acetyl-beta-D-mannosaminyltransferase